MAFYSSVSTLLGAISVNRSFPAKAQSQDPGGKIAVLVSAMNGVLANMALIQTAVLSANASAVSFSSLSGVTFTSTYTTLTNFS